MAMMIVELMIVILAKMIIMGTMEIFERKK